MQVLHLNHMICSQVQERFESLKKRKVPGSFTEQGKEIKKHFKLVSITITFFIIFLVTEQFVNTVHNSIWTYFSEVKIFYIEMLKLKVYNWTHYPGPIWNLMFPCKQFDILLLASDFDERILKQQQEEEERKRERRERKKEKKVRIYLFFLLLRDIINASRF